MNISLSLSLAEGLHLGLIWFVAQMSQTKFWLLPKVGNAKIRGETYCLDCGQVNLCMMSKVGDYDT